MQKTGFGIIFGFSLCTAFLHVALVTYLKKGLDKLNRLGLPEDSKVYHY